MIVINFLSYGLNISFAVYVISFTVQQFTIQKDKSYNEFEPKFYIHYINRSKHYLKIISKQLTHHFPSPQQTTQMDLQMQKLNEQQQQLNHHNQQLKRRAEKFGSAYTPMNLQEFRNFKIKKASQTGKLAYLEDVLLNDIKDKQQRKKMIQQRKGKFFPQIKVNQSGNFDKKDNVDFTQDDVKIRDNAWYLYGVDYMSNQTIRNYFRGNAHFKIQWLNDSSCNIVFPTSEQAVQAIKPHVKGTAQHEQFAQTWYQLQDYQVQGTKRQLACRLATNKDVKNTQRSGRDSEYYKWVLNKKKFHRFVKDRAFTELKKTKKIQKQEKNERVKKERAKKEEEDEDSSSGVDDSESPLPEPQVPQELNAENGTEMKNE